MAAKLRIWLTRNSQLREPDSHGVLCTELFQASEPSHVRKNLVNLDPASYERQIKHELMRDAKSFDLPLEDVSRGIAENSGLFQEFMKKTYNNSFVWLETCHEYRVFEDGDLRSNGVYAGGRFAVGEGCTFPLGASGMTAEEAWLRLAERVAEWTQPPSRGIGLRPFDAETQNLSLDGLSGGVLLHEIVGHVSESDFTTQTEHRIRNLEIFDVPCSSSGMDYSISDQGRTGHAVQLATLDGKIDFSTGNGFICWGPKELPQLLVRQRNLEARFVGKQDTGQPSNHSWGANGILMGAGVNSKDGKIVLRCGVKTRDTIKAIKIVIPPNLKLDVAANRLPIKTNSSICMKSGRTHIVSLSSPGIDVTFQSSIGNLLVE